MSDKTFQIKPTIWVGLGALAFDILLAAGLGNMIGVLFPKLSDLQEFALSHLIPLPIAIAVGYIVARKAGWLASIFRSTPSYQDQPTRRWLLIFPALLAVQSIACLLILPWGEHSLLFVLVSLIAVILVAVNEEFFFRGIFRFTVEQHYGQTVTLILTSLLFGLAHAFASIAHGLPIGFIAFQVATTAFVGATYYASFVATGRLWVPITFHFITDFSLRIGSGEAGVSSPTSTGDVSPIMVGTQMILVFLMLPLLISVVRHDFNKRKRKDDSR